MDAKDWVQPVHFREFHLLPRVIFSIGAVCYIGAFFVKSLPLGLAGLAVIFAACAYNLIVDLLLERWTSRKLNVIMLVHSIIAIGLTAVMWYFASKIYEVCRSGL